MKEHEGYLLAKNQIKELVDSQNWTQIDKKLQQIPSGVYTFQPKIEDKIYYQRLLYCLSHQQQSQKALNLTSYLLCLNTNNYYAMMLRNQCFLKKLKQCHNKQQQETMLKKQLHFASCLLNKNPKQYQIWNYKKDLIGSPAAKSLPIIEKLREYEEQFIFFLMTNDDQKNYHAWDYKTWLARQSDLELKIKQTQSMLFINITDSDFKCESLWSNCYSCWSYRFNLIMDLPIDKRTSYFHEDTKKVVDFVIKNSNNQCAWNYLEGLMDIPEIEETQKETIVQKIHSRCKGNLNKNKFAWSFLLQVGQRQIQKESLEHLETIDPIRQLYYTFIKETF